MFFLKKYFQNRKGLQKLSTEHVPHAPKEDFKKKVIFIILIIHFFGTPFIFFYLFKLTSASPRCVRKLGHLGLSANRQGDEGP